MDIFSCFNNMQISRYAAIKYAQLMANNNLVTLFNASTNNKWGVLTSVASDGLIPDEDTSLKVSKLPGSSSILEIQPGVAITPAGDVAVNNKVYQLNAQEIAGTGVGAPGVYNLYIRHAVAYSMTGEEKFYSHHTSSSIGTIEKDSCEFLFTKDSHPECVLLAKVLYLAGVYIVEDFMPVPAVLAANTVIYPGETYIPFTGISSITGSPYVVQFPYVRVGKEYLRLVSTNTWERAYADTNEETYYAGENAMQWSPIMDMRQTNACRININIGDIEKLNNGVMISPDGKYRHIERTAKKNPPSTPTVTAENNEIVWLNSHLAAGYLTADMVAAYDEVQGIQESINNTLAMINQLRQDYAEAAGNTVTQDRIQNEIQRQQLSLMDYRVREANLKTTLSNRTMDSIKNYDMRQFAYAIYVPGVTLTEGVDEPVQYEVEVDFSIVDSPRENVSASITRWYYSRRKNVASIDWKSMERTYEDSERTTGSFNVVYIPIRFGERIKYRVRAIGESNTASDFTPWFNFSFTGYSISQQYVMVNNIYNFLNPDPYQDGIITRELVDYLYSVIEEFRDSTNRLTTIETQISALESEA